MNKILRFCSFRTKLKKRTQTDTLSFLKNLTDLKRLSKINTKQKMLNLRNLKKGVKKPHLILPALYTLFKNRQNNKHTRKIREKILQKNIIWHFCTPKSASTFLLYLLTRCNTNIVSSIPYQENRSQISDFFFLWQNINKFIKKKPFYVNQQHTVCDNHLKQYISEKHVVIIQTRNIYKTILSLKDFIISENLFNINPFVQWHPNKYCEKDILKLLIYHYVPFHIKFIKSWIENEIKGRKIFINYKDFIKNPDQIIKKILGNEIKINKQLYELEIINKKSINYNIGSKRENTLQDDEKKLIDDIVDISVKHSDPQIKYLIYQE